MFNSYILAAITMQIRPNLRESIYHKKGRSKSSKAKVNYVNLLFTIGKNLNLLCMIAAFKTAEAL